MTLLPPRIIVEDLIYLTGCGLVTWKGGAAERMVGVVLLVEFALSFATLPFESIEGPHYLHLVLSLGILAAVLYAAFRYHERWPLVGSALQLLCILTHIARIIDPSIRNWAYVTVSIALGYGVVLTALYGTVTHMKRRGGSGARQRA